MVSKALSNLFRIRPEGSSNRVELLDFLRGAAMILVLLQHARVPYGEYILAFHMPLFFVLSGYTQAVMDKQQRFSRYFAARFCRLVIPYFLFEGANLLLWSASLIRHGGWQDVTEAVYAIAACLNTEGYTGYYGRLWFLPCMFVSEILFFAVKKLCRGKRPLTALFSALLLMISWYTSCQLPGRLPFTLDTAFMAAAFLTAGYCARDLITWLLKETHIVFDILLFAAMSLAVHCCITFTGSSFLMYDNFYRPFAWSVVSALCGCIGFLVAAKWLYALLIHIPALRDLVLWYGCNSLATFPIHLSIKVHWLNHFGWDFPWYSLFLIMLLVNIPIVNFITAYLPFMLGKFPRKKGS